MTNQEIFTALMLDSTDKAVLAEYGQADMIIWSCQDTSCHHCPHWTVSEVQITNPKFSLSRLLATGEWQTAQEREVENEKRLQEVRG